VDATVRLPREVEADARHADIRRVLAARTRRLWEQGTLEVPVVALSSALRQELEALTARGFLVRGLEGAHAALGAEQRGLDALAPGVAARQGRRVSRLVFVTRDGAERFYRRVERLAIIHAPRVLVAVLDAESPELGEMLYAPGTAVKLLMTGHKSAAARLLQALVSVPGPAPES
jgi:hypothetical protein